MRHASRPERGRSRAPAPAALLLALCLLAGGAQALTGPLDMASLVTGEGGIDRGASAGTTVTDPPVASSRAADGEPFRVLPGPAHAWVAGDVFSLHGVDRYRYVVAYTRDTLDGPVHGCYEVEQAAPGRYEVAQYVHGQEVFGDAFLAGQGARFLEHVPLGTVTITDETPADSGRTYAGTTLGAIFGAADAPVPAETPGRVPTAPLRPTPAPTKAVGMTRTPGTAATLPGGAAPMPAAPPAAAQPLVTEPPLATPTDALVLAPAAGPAVAIRAETGASAATRTPASPGVARAKRYAVGDPGPFIGATFGAGGASTGTGLSGATVAPAVTEKPGSRAFGTTPPAGRFVRWYPAARWAAGIT